MSSFEEVFERIKRATNTRTQVELAEVLEIRQSSISDAKRRNSVPSDWYLKLFEKFGLNPDWLKLGVGPAYLKDDQGKYEPFDGPAMTAAMEDASRYSDSESRGQVVSVHSMQCDMADDAGWEPKKIGKLNVPQSYAGSSILVVKMDSSSMEPIIRRGAFVGIDQDQRNVVSGELYGVFVPHEGLAVKRVFLDAEKDRFILRSENESHPEQFMPIADRATKIKGRAVWVLQGL